MPTDNRHALCDLPGEALARVLHRLGVACNKSPSSSCYDRAFPERENINRSSSACCVSMPQSAMNQHAVQEGWHHLGEQQRAVVVVDQLSAQQKASAIFLPGWWDVRGWGFGVSIVTRRDSIWTSPGQFGWGGAFRHFVDHGPAREPGCHPNDSVHGFSAPSGRYPRGFPHLRLSSARGLRPRRLPSLAF